MNLKELHAWTHHTVLFVQRIIYFSPNDPPQAAERAR